MTKLGPLPDVPSVCKIELLAVQSGQPVVNLFHVRYAGAAPSSPELDQYASQVLGGWSNNIMPLCSNQLAMTGCVVTDLTSRTSAVGSSAGSAPGTISGDALDAGSAAVVSHHISRRYRGGHPRSYIAGRHAGQLVSSRQWTAQFVSDLGAGFGGFLATVSPVTIGTTEFETLVSVSYLHAGAYRVGGPVVDVIIGSAIQPRVCHQRRRVGVLIPE